MITNMKCAVFIFQAMNSTTAPCTSVENGSDMSSRSLTDTSTTEQSPGSYSNPNSPPDLSVEGSPIAADTYKSCAMKLGCYSSTLSPPSSPNGLSGSIMTGGHSPPPLPGSALPYATPPPATMLPTPMYPSQDYSTGPLSTASMPMPMWR